MNDQYVIPAADDSQVPPGYRYLSKDETIVDSDRRWESPDENPGMDETGMPAGWVKVPLLDIGGTPAIHGDKYIRKDTQRYRIVTYVTSYPIFDEDCKGIAELLDRYQNGVMEPMQDEPEEEEVVRVVRIDENGEEVPLTSEEAEAVKDAGYNTAKTAPED